MILYALKRQKYNKDNKTNETANYFSHNGARVDRNDTVFLSSIDELTDSVKEEMFLKAKGLRLDTDRQREVKNFGKQNATMIAIPIVANN
jgi:hypothetical protein